MKDIVAKNDNDVTEERAIKEVRELVEAASVILKGLGSDRERIAWMLEDALDYLNDVKGFEGLNSTSAAIDYLESLDEKVINN